MRLVSHLRENSAVLKGQKLDRSALKPRLAARSQFTLDFMTNDPVQTEAAIRAAATAAARGAPLVEACLSKIVAETNQPSLNVADRITRAVTMAEQFASQPKALNALSATPQEIQAAHAAAQFAARGGIPWWCRAVKPPIGAGFEPKSFRRPRPHGLGRHGPQGLQLACVGRLQQAAAWRCSANSDAIEPMPLGDSRSTSYPIPYRPGAMMPFGSSAVFTLWHASR